MRYYQILIKEINGKIIQRFSSRKADNTPDPGALDIELDIPVYSFEKVTSGAVVRIYGIGLDQVSQSMNFNDKIIEVYAGMDKGLSLANPRQAGIIARGKIFQSIGTWQGINQFIDFYFRTDTGSQDNPANIVLNWKAGTKLSAALKNTLTAAFPGFTIITTISDRLILPNDEIGIHQNIYQLAQYLKTISQTIVKDQTYPGVRMFIRENQIVIFDGTSPKKPKQITFNDFIGQPSWKGPLTVSFQVVLRADLTVSDYIVLPNQSSLTKEQSFSRYGNNLTFKGNFRIVSLRHIGSFKQPDALSWVTAIEANSIGRS